ncbi:MAG: hypothetical protein U0M21_00610 [Emergencia sp.]|nr:hypothetical protein [Emergencia sp.]
MMSRLVRVKVGPNLYKMTEKELKGLLAVASEQIPFGIYAVKKGDYVELVRERCKTITQLKQRIRAYKAEGFGVYANKE